MHIVLYVVANIAAGRLGVLLFFVVLRSCTCCVMMFRGGVGWDVNVMFRGRVGWGGMWTFMYVLRKFVASSIVDLAGSIVCASTNGDTTLLTSLRSSSRVFGFGRGKNSMKTAVWILACLCWWCVAAALEFHWIYWVLCFCTDSTELRGY